MWRCLLHQQPAIVPLNSVSYSTPPGIESISGNSRSLSVCPCPHGGHDMVDMNIMDMDMVDIDIVDIDMMDMDMDIVDIDMVDIDMVDMDMGASL